jgi:hypothetical protein
MARNLEQIQACWNRFAIPADLVNLLYLSDVERIHAIELIAIRSSLPCGMGQQPPHLGPD